MSPYSFRLTSILALALLTLPTQAHAEYPAPAPYIGVHGGANLQLRPWDLGDYTPEGLSNVALGAGFLGGARVGVQIVPRFGVELGGSLTPVNTLDGASNLVGSVDLDAFFHITKGDWAPYVLLGGGGYIPFDGDIGADFDPHGQVGVDIHNLFLQ